VLFLTPHVITDLEESNRVTQEVREKMFGIRKELERQKKEDEKQRKTEQQGKGQPTNPKEGAQPNNPAPAGVATNRDSWSSDIPP
jgi:hypothetical protein